MMMMMMMRFTRILVVATTGKQASRFCLTFWNVVPPNYRSFCTGGDDEGKAEREREV